MTASHLAACFASALTAFAAIFVPGSGAMAADTGGAGLGGRSGHMLFEVDRDGSKIGTHRLEFHRDNGALNVDIDIELRVGLGPLTLFRYEHTNATQWEAGQLVRMDAKTNDDGDEHRVEVRRDGEGKLIIRTDGAETKADGDLLPSTYWMRATVEQSRLLNTQTGEIGTVEIESLGTRTVETPDGPVEAEGYELTGDLEARTWYDAQGRWVKLAFEARGSEITYRLVEREGFVPSGPPASGS